jgi:hypothetical protein
MRLLKLVVLLATLGAIAAAVAQADPGRNLEAVLRPAAGAPDNGFGLVKFREPKDESAIVYLDVWVRDLAPNQEYRLQRATDATVNDVCAGTNWVTLGRGPDAQTIGTDETGTGRAELYRDLGVALLGVELDIKFRVIDATGGVVLESGCYQFTVSQ